MTRKGRTAISPAALRHTLEAVTAHAFAVPRSSVGAELQDDAGKLAARITVRLALPLLTDQASGNAGSTLFEQTRHARAAIFRRGTELSGLLLGRLDITLTGTRQPAQLNRVGAPPAGGHERRHRRRLT